MKLPLVSGKELLKFFEKQGYRIVRQRGSHISLYKETDSGKLLVVVVNKPEINKRTLTSILHQAKLTREEFLALWGRK